MVRKNYLQLLQDKYDISKEFDKVTEVFHKNIVQHKYNTGYIRTSTKYYTLEQMVRGKFGEWKGRGTCIDVQNMRNELGIDVLIKKINKEPDEMILGLEYYLNIENLFYQKVVPGLPRYEYALLNDWNILKENISILLDKLCVEKYYDKEKECIFLIPKNLAATAVAEISSEGTAMAILMYHHASLQGQLEEKRKLLLTIAREYEPLLNKGIEGFKAYFDNARNMLNNAHLRHNNKSGKDKIEKIAQMSDKELENWYDELYQLLLFCVLIEDNKKRNDKVAKFFKNLKETK